MGKSGEGLGGLKAGDYSLFTKTVSEPDITFYAGMSADFSPLCLNETYAKKSRFSGRAAHPMLIGAMAAGAVYRLLPPGAWCLERSFQTEGIVRPGDTVTAVARVQSLEAETGRVRLELMCYNQREELVLRGTSLEELGEDEGEGKR